MLLKMFRHCYLDDEGSYNQFLQSDINKRVLLLDDVNDIQKEQVYSLLKIFDNSFGLIVYTSNADIELDLAERIKQNAEMEEYVRFRILPMNMDKRYSLVKRIIEIEKEESENGLADTIAEIIKSQRKMYSMNASFVIQFTEYYLKNFRDAAYSEGNIFSKVFESNLVSRIRFRRKDLTVDKVLVLFDEIAYWQFKNGQNSISQSQICNLIEAYNERQGDAVNIIDFIEAGTNSKIIKEIIGKSSYRFTEKNALSYFVARKIIRNWNDELDDSDLEYLMRYIKYGINSNIILFITYLTDQMYLIQHIIETTKKYTDNWTIVDIINVNVPYLAELTGQITVDPPALSDRKKTKDRDWEEDKRETAEYEEEQIKVKDFFEADVNDSEEKMNQIIRGVTLLDIVSKCLPGFEHRLNREQKEEIANIIFHLPGKIFYLWTECIEAERDELLEYLLNEYRTVYLDSRDWNSVKKEDMLRFLQLESVYLLLDLMNLPMINSSRNYTMRYFENYSNVEEVLYKIQMLMAYDKVDDVNEFERHYGEYNDALKDCLPDFMKKNVLKHFLVTSRKINNSKVQSMISRYFPKNNSRTNKIYKNILISRERNKRKNK